MVLTAAAGVGRVSGADLGESVTGAGPGYGNIWSQAQSVADTRTQNTDTATMTIGGPHHKQCHNIAMWLIISCAEVAELRALPVGRGQIGRVKYLAVGRAKPGQGRGGGQVSCDWRTAAT